jgi:hypothetical protein
MEFKENQKFKVLKNALGIPENFVKDAVLTIVRGPRTSRPFIPETASEEELRTPKITTKEWRCKLTFISIDRNTKKEKLIIHRYWLGEDYLENNLDHGRMVEIHEE